MPTIVETAEIAELIRSRDLPQLASRVRELPLPEIALLLESLPSDDAAVVFRLLDKDESIEVFDCLDPNMQAELVAELGEGNIAEVFEALEPSGQAWLLDELPARVAKRLITSADDAKFGAVMALLGYPHDSLGRRMSTVPLTAAPDATVGDVLDQVGVSDKDLSLLRSVAVMGADRTLLGVLDPLELVSEPRGRHIMEVIKPPVSAFTEDNAEQVSRKCLDAGTLLLPVVDREDRLVGVFPIEDAARVDREAVAEDQARAGGAEPLRRPYLQTPIGDLVKSRIVWLLVLAVSAVLTVSVLELFEATLAQRFALALFVPLLIGIGGNTGSQAATTVTRSLALGEIAPKSVGSVAMKEIRTGALLGVALAALGFTVASLIYGVDIGLVIGITLVLICPIAATVGGVIPLAARALRVDPAVFSTPFIATFCDATGLLVYFTVAKAVLGL